MIIRKYGLELRRLEMEDLELVRTMRNKKSIQDKMFFRQEISKEQQVEWFHSISDIYHYYFVIVYKGNKVGLIHGNILSFEDKVAEGGMFIWDDYYQKTHIPVIASVCLADLTFLIMEMEKTVADIRMDNKVAIDYNLKLGYTIVEEIEKEGKLKMELRKDDYFEKAVDVRNMVKKVGNDISDISWQDITIPRFIAEPHYVGLPDYLQTKINALKK